jgi:hypothetical protein
LKLASLVCLVTLSACGGAAEITGPDTAPPVGDTATDDTGTPPLPAVTVSDLSWRLHDGMESFVRVSWRQDADATVRVEYSFDADEWLSTPTAASTTGDNERLIVGIPFGATARWRVVAEQDGAEPVDGPEITTGALSADFPEGAVTVSEGTRWLQSGRYLLTSISQEPNGWAGGWYWTYIMDRRGRVVWANRTPDQHWTLFAQVAASGDHILWDQATFWAEWDDGADSVVHAAWLDEEIEIVPTPGLHHAFVQLPDGTLAWGSQDHGGGEALVQLAPGAADEEVLWTVSQDWPPGNGGWQGPESNGLFYVEGADSFLYSYYTNNSVVEVERAGGTSVWWAGDAQGGYAFDPPSAQFEWQHGISYTDAGTLLVSSEHSDGGPSHTWLLEYEVDHGAQTLRLVWGSDSGVAADTNGQAWRLSNGNTLHVVGSAGVVREVDPAGEDVWRVEYGNQYLLGHGQLIEDLYALVKPTE